MNITRWPDLLRLDPFEDNWRSLVRPLTLETNGNAPQMRLDVSEKDGLYTVKAELPGVKKEDIDVRIDGRQVSLSAEVRRDRQEPESEGDGLRTLRSERYYGFVSRSFSLTDDVDESKAQARYEDGVLELTLPKKVTAASKRLSVA